MYKIHLEEAYKRISALLIYGNNMREQGDFLPPPYTYKIIFVNTFVLNLQQRLNSSKHEQKIPESLEIIIPRKRRGKTKQRTIKAKSNGRGRGRRRKRAQGSEEKEELRGVGKGVGEGRGGKGKDLDAERSTAKS
ncbi:hypothetical protein PoB_003933200 [Plakobranchus ocellatus]|uniref:Uncharacterized protein n=1 Tax=Plakobranchus ocellatus TaxID=259542 RepID=A0AAV4B127_9GAST|nr:hypothetical protein PoB_003933200 [Plakobranchus ocellatus]